mmetsp:Transcript_41744/g.74988  ORF Transcript_41744/g.74988 Transcript_41744/m.74988 type:complete len:227 (+) Transcript_41744:68-748(+)
MLLNPDTKLNCVDGKSLGRAPPPVPPSLHIFPCRVAIGLLPGARGSKAKGRDSEFEAVRRASAAPRPHELHVAGALDEALACGDAGAVAKLQAVPREKYGVVALPNGGDPPGQGRLTQPSTHRRVSIRIMHCDLHTPELHLGCACVSYAYSILELIAPHFHVLLRLKEAGALHLHVRRLSAAAALLQRRLLPKQPYRTQCRVHRLVSLLTLRVQRSLCPEVFSYTC